VSSQLRLTNAYQNAKRISYDDTSRFILFSDCHRGDNSFADDFANNRNIYFHALTHYLKNDFQYIELGDGDELWENLFFKDIFEANKNVYLLMKKFHDANKMHLIYGNHDMVYRNPLIVKRNLFEYFETISGKKEPLLPHITFHEGIVLEHKQTQQEIFLTHGHQAEFMNSVGWKINRFLVRVLWKPLQVWGIKDPTSPAKNYKGSIKVERKIKKWIADNKNLLTIVGHTHRPHFPEPKELNFFNCGSCVHPRSITGIEIYEGTIALIKWQIATNDLGVLQIVKEYMEGPVSLKEYEGD
jgi:predicted phosphodiesterase